MKKLKIATFVLSFLLLSSTLFACGRTATNAPPPNASLPNEPPMVEITPPSEQLPPTEEVPPAEETPPPVVVKAEYARCTGNGVNLRAGAGTDFAVVGRAEKGTTYAIIGKTGNWYKTYYRGKVAYLSASYAAVFALERTEKVVEQVIDEGYKHLGVPYVYGAVRFHDGTGRLLGGFTAQKFDCSSLMQYIFYQGAGKVIGVHTRAQVKEGKYVHPDDLRRGDCIFFTNEVRQYKTGIERVGHVALYLGDGYILHTSSDYARIEKMTKQRWDFYIEARRFV